MTFTVAALALGIALGQHTATPAEQAAAPSSHGAATAEHAPATAEHAAAPGGHGATLPEVMMHHVANGYEVEYPGFCNGFHWNCKLDLQEATGGWTIKLGQARIDMTPTKHTVMLWLAAALVTFVVLLASRKRSLVPRGLYNFIELLVQFVRDIAVSNIGKKDADRFVPYLCSAFFFILFANLLGLVPFMATATANISVTVAFALFTFVVTQYAAIRSQGFGGYLKHLTGGVPASLAWLWPIMIPVEFLGLFTKPFALTVRLFANMVAGHFVILALLGLIFSISVWVAPVSVALALAIFMLELFVAFVQAYIFTMLSALFIGAGLVHHDDSHGHAGHGEVHDASHATGKAPGHG